MTRADAATLALTLAIASIIALARVAELLTATNPNPN